MLPVAFDNRTERTCPVARLVDPEGALKQEMQRMYRLMDREFEAVAASRGKISLSWSHHSSFQGPGPPTTNVGEYTVLEWPKKRATSEYMGT